MALLKTSSYCGMLHSFLNLIRHEFLQNTCKRITLGFFIAFLNSLPLPNVTLFYFIIQLPILLSFAKQWQTIAWIRRFFLHMVALSNYILSKLVQKVRSCCFNLFAHSLLHTDTQVLTRHVSKMVELCFGSGDTVTLDAQIAFWMYFYSCWM